MVVASFPRSNATMSCKTFWVRIEKRPYFEGYRLCGVTRRTRPETTSQLAPRGQRGYWAAPMRWFECRLLRRRLMAGLTHFLAADPL